MSLSIANPKVGDIVLETRHTGVEKAKFIIIDRSAHYTPGCWVYIVCTIWTQPGWGLLPGDTITISRTTMINSGNTWTLLWGDESGV